MLFFAPDNDDAVVVEFVFVSAVALIAVVAVVAVVAAVAVVVVAVGSFAGAVNVIN